MGGGSNEGRTNCPKNFSTFNYKKGIPHKHHPKNYSFCSLKLIIERQNKLHRYTAHGKGVTANSNNSGRVENATMKSLMKPKEKTIQAQTALSPGGGSYHGNPAVMNCDETLISHGNDNNNLCPPSCNQPQNQLLNASFVLVSTDKAILC